MGKKESILKIPKKNTSEKNKKDFKSWLNVLRPKVYITDSSSFKSLVQQLTGNGRTSSSSYSISPPSMEEPREVENLIIPKANIELEDYREPESSTDVTIDACVDHDDSSDDHQHYLYSSQVLSTTTSTDQDHHHHHQDHDDHQVLCDQIWLEDHTSLLEDLMVDQQDDQVDLLAYGSLESWLLDVDHHPYSFCNNGFVQNQQEVSIYDYELSGLLSN